MLCNDEMLGRIIMWAYYQITAIDFAEPVGVRRPSLYEYIQTYNSM